MCSRHRLHQVERSDGQTSRWMSYPWVGGCFDLLSALGIPSPIILPDEDEPTKVDEDEGGEDTEGPPMTILILGKSASMTPSDSRTISYTQHKLKAEVFEINRRSASFPSISTCLTNLPFYRSPDAYYTLFNIVGLSSAQHHCVPHPSTSPNFSICSSFLHRLRLRLSVRKRRTWSGGKRYGVLHSRG